MPQGMRAEAKYLSLRPLGAEYTLKHLDYPPDSRVALYVFEDCYTNIRRVGHKCFATISLVLVALIVVHLLEQYYVALLESHLGSTDIATLIVLVTEPKRPVNN